MADSIWDYEYNEPGGSLLSVGLHLVKVSAEIDRKASAEEGQDVYSTRGGKSKTKGTLQLSVVHHCAEGTITDYIPVMVMDKKLNRPVLSFRIAQLVAAVLGKEPKDITKDQWGRFGRSFGNLSTVDEVEKLAKWFREGKFRGDSGVEDHRPYWITVLEETNDGGKTNVRVGAFRDQAIRPCEKHEIKDWRPYVPESAVEDVDPFAEGTEEEGMPF